MPAKPALRTELLFYLSFLAAAALLVGVATLLIATSFAPERTFALVMLMIALEVGVFIVFGRYLVNRLVLWPLERVVATADAVADGDLGRRAPDAVTRGAYGLLEAQGALKPVRATLEVAPDLPRMLGRAHLLEQAVVNLVLNAVDAAGDGVVILGVRAWAYESRRASPRRASDPQRTTFPRWPESRPARTDFVAGQRGVLLYVADSGPGVPPEDREQVFDPFYTTKEPGRGTGLGLAIVARAVHDMGGVVCVVAAREGGAGFKMFFPAA